MYSSKKCCNGVAPHAVTAQSRPVLCAATHAVPFHLICENCNPLPSKQAAHKSLGLKHKKTACLYSHTTQSWNTAAAAGIMLQKNLRAAKKHCNADPAALHRHCRSETSQPRHFTRTFVKQTRRCGESPYQRFLIMQTPFVGRCIDFS